MKPQINALTATRAVAALMVFIHHFGGNVFPFNLCPSVFHSGNVAVSYFFVLSGFVLFISYGDKGIGYREYMKRRIGRIVPIYLFALVLSIGVAFCFYHYTMSGLTIKQIVFSALFLQAFIPGYPLCLNGPGWTISVEMFFYFLFPLLLSFQKKKFVPFLVLTIVLYIVSQALHLYYYPIRWSGSNSIVDTVFYNPIIHINQFMTGMVGAHLFFRRQDANKKNVLLPLLLFIVIILLVAYKPDNISYQVGLIAPVFVLFIVSVAVNNPKFLNIRPLVFLGEISYGIYILQQPVHQYFEILNNSYFHMGGLFLFYFSLFFLIVCSSVTYYLLELPLRRRIAAI